MVISIIAYGLKYIYEEEKDRRDARDHLHNIYIYDREITRRTTVQKSSTNVLLGTETEVGKEDTHSSLCFCRSHIFSTK